jgi:hypothetical protein
MQAMPGMGGLAEGDGARIGGFTMKMKLKPPPRRGKQALKCMSFSPEHVIVTQSAKG